MLRLTVPRNQEPLRVSGGLLRAHNLRIANLRHGRIHHRHHPRSRRSSLMWTHASPCLAEEFSISSRRVREPKETLLFLISVTPF